MMFSRNLIKITISYKAYDFLAFLDPPRIT